ncbi:hypothetical protein APR08_005781 [Nocardia amikacinitolerans]|nr:hypothetical protein [Nocardia amikacinitolerans]
MAALRVMRVEPVRQWGARGTLRPVRLRAAACMRWVALAALRFGTGYGLSLCGSWRNFRRGAASGTGSGCSGAGRRGSPQVCLERCWARKCPAPFEEYLGRPSHLDRQNPGHNPGRPSTQPAVSGSPTPGEYRLASPFARDWLAPFARDHPHSQPRVRVQGRPRAPIETHGSPAEPTPSRYGSSKTARTARRRTAVHVQPFDPDAAMRRPASRSPTSPRAPGPSAHETIRGGALADCWNVVRRAWPIAAVRARVR